uniref:Uncharacterized protein n=1 Tax=Auxenochlorella protothecoides TaxID=3075 RepID=A0A1D1ZX81_AUXPR
MAPRILALAAAVLCTIITCAGAPVNSPTSGPPIFVASGEAYGSAQGVGANAGSSASATSSDTGAIITGKGSGEASSDGAVRAEVSGAFSGTAGDQEVSSSFIGASLAGGSLRGALTASAEGRASADEAGAQASGKCTTSAGGTIDEVAVAGRDPTLLGIGCNLPSPVPTPSPAAGPSPSASPSTSSSPSPSPGTVLDPPLVYAGATFTPYLYYILNVQVTTTFAAATISCSLKDSQGVTLQIETVQADASRTTSFSLDVEETIFVAAASFTCFATTAGGQDSPTAVPQ